MEGQVTVYDPRQPDSSCYQCLYQDKGELQQSCSETGVLSPLLGVIGSIQAVETVKLIAQVGQSLAGRLLLLDAATMQWREIQLKPDPNCPICQSSH
jgi:adenylyltransferase/sulfurtransferase